MKLTSEEEPTTESPPGSGSITELSTAGQHVSDPTEVRQSGAGSDAAAAVVDSFRRLTGAPVITGLDEVNNKQ